MLHAHLLIVSGVCLFARSVPPPPPMDDNLLSLPSLVARLLTRAFSKFGLTTTSAGKANSSCAPTDGCCITASSSTAATVPAIVAISGEEKIAIIVIDPSNAPVNTLLRKFRRSSSQRARTRPALPIDREQTAIFLTLAAREAA